MIIRPLEPGEAGFLRIRAVSWDGERHLFSWYEDRGGGEGYGRALLSEFNAYTSTDALVQAVQTLYERALQNGARAEGMRQITERILAEVYEIGTHATSPTPVLTPSKGSPP